MPMIRSKLGSFLGSFWRILKDEIVPLIFGLLMFLSFVFSCLVFSYMICRGWIILFTGDVDFMPPLDVLFHGMMGG